VSGPKLIVCSVRAPISVTRGEDGWVASASPGGLATALRAVAESRAFTWVGFPGTPVPKEEQGAVRELIAEHGAAPVFLEEEEFHLFYEEFSNRVLWPLFHGLPTPREFSRAAWECYRNVNAKFADEIAQRVDPDDTVWVHDYQLLLVPQMLRERGIDCRIGFFLHIPFPSPDVYRTLPNRSALLRGMLSADVLGFHTYEYVTNFRSALLRVAGIESEPESVSRAGHVAHLAVLPIGIDPEQVESMTECEDVKADLASLRETYGGQTTILGVDRLDYTKGLPEKLLAYERLLAERPDLHGKVTLIQIAAPSRTGVIEYQALREELEGLAGRINGRFGTLTWTPIVYVNRNLAQQELAAMYQLADIMLVAPVRDGMNLVCMEYVAARGDNPGTLLLSEFAGAASSLAGAVLINPHDTDEVARALAKAIENGPNAEGFKHMRSFVLSNTVTAWANAFLHQLEDPQTVQRARAKELRVGTPDVDRLVSGASLPLILLDYDGTLRPHTTLPEQAKPTVELRTLLGDLARYGVVYVVSGRPAVTLEEWLGDLPVGLVCEHGLGVRHRGQDWQRQEDLDVGALETVVEPIFSDFHRRTPGSKVERKEASMAWHYRATEPTYGAWRAKELRALLESRLAGLPFSVLAGSKVIEVRHVQMNKGRAVAGLLEHHSGTDLVVCFGDDRTDEDMFEAILERTPDNAIICRVGDAFTVAPYNVPNSAAVHAQLGAMIEMWKNARS
jgi:trehalose 6-phosphate synthase/phosphatase